MRGRIRDYSPVTGSGVITGSDGVAYTFLTSDWRESDAPAAGLDVDFVVTGGRATSVYRAAGSSAGAGYGGGASGSGYRGAGAGAGSASGGSGYGGSSYARSRGRRAKSRGAAAFLALFLGTLGVHKFYLGYTAQGMTILVAAVASTLVWSIALANFGEIADYVIEFVGYELYWGYSTEQRFILISETVVGTMLWSIIIGALASFAVAAVALIEFVTYISMTDEQFEETYVEGRRAWF